jgi:hypothetical protein
LEAVRIVLFVPAVVGVPLITPLVPTVSPTGVFVPLKVIGVLPLAVIVQFELTPTLPRNELVDVNTGAEPIPSSEITRKP